MQTVSKFDIYLPGDPSVGHFATTWQLVGPFFFEDYEDRKAFEKELQESMSSLADDAVVIYAYDETGLCMDAGPEPEEHASRLP